MQTKHIFIVKKGKIYGKSRKIKVNKNVIVLHIVGDVWKDHYYYNVFSTSNREETEYAYKVVENSDMIDEEEYKNLSIITITLINTAKICLCLLNMQKKMTLL